MKIMRGRSTGAWAATHSASAIPDMPGIIRSQSATSKGGPVSMRRRASSPEVAVTTLK